MDRRGAAVGHHHQDLGVARRRVRVRGAARVLRSRCDIERDDPVRVLRFLIRLAVRVQRIQQRAFHFIYGVLQPRLRCGHGRHVHDNLKHRQQSRRQVDGERHVVHNRSSEYERVRRERYARDHRQLRHGCVEGGV